MKKTFRYKSIQTINDYILVEPLKEEEMNQSGIILPKTQNKHVKFARVIQISPDVPAYSQREHNDKLRYKEGDIIIYYEKHGIPIHDPEEDRELEFLKWTGMLGLAEEDMGEE